MDLSKELFFFLAMSVSIIDTIQLPISRAMAGLLIGDRDKFLNNFFPFGQEYQLQVGKSVLVNLLSQYRPSITRFKTYRELLEELLDNRFGFYRGREPVWCGMSVIGLTITDDGKSVATYALRIIDHGTCLKRMGFQTVTFYVPKIDPPVVDHYSEEFVQDFSERLLISVLDMETNDVTLMT